MDQSEQMQDITLQHMLDIIAKLAKCIHANYIYEVIHNEFGVKPVCGHSWHAPFHLQVECITNNANYTGLDFIARVFSCAFERLNLLDPDPNTAIILPRFTMQEDITSEQANDIITAISCSEKYYDSKKQLLLNFGMVALFCKHEEHCGLIARSQCLGLEMQNTMPNIASVFFAIKNKHVCEKGGCAQ